MPLPCAVSSISLISETNLSFFLLFHLFRLLDEYEEVEDDPLSELPHSESIGIEVSIALISPFCLLLSFLF